MTVPEIARDWKPEFQEKFCSPRQAVKKIEPGDRVFIGSGAAVPLDLIKSMAAESDSFYDTELIHILTLGMDPTTEKTLSDKFRHSAFFLGSNVREAVREGRADYTPIFLSEIPHLFKTGAHPVDVALIAISTPDRHGFASYGVSVDIVKSATEAAQVVIAQVNPKMPRTLGDSFIHLDEIDCLVLGEEPLPELQPHSQDEVSKKIGRFVASLVPDGATLQLGIGGIPDAVLANLHDKKDLGVHTEMISDGALELIEKGILNNERKTLHRRKIITSFVMGTKKLYDFVDNNPLFEFRPSQYTNDPFVIAQNDNMIAINSALEVDLTGQVCADSIGHRFYSGIGGQVDFIRGAAKSRGGKPIIALPSTAKGGAISRIKVQLTEGAGVVTTRGDVHYVVTEYGIAYLHGKNIRHRALSLISIAHPRFRKELLDGAKEKGYLDPEETVITDTKAVYPVEYEKSVTIRGGEQLLIRPLKRTDDELIRELFYSHSDESRYYRFFSAQKRISKRDLQYLVNIDYHGKMALCAVKKVGPREKILGVARYYKDEGTSLAEFAIAVHDEWQGKGLGKALMRHLIKVARDRGIKGFTADVLADNSKMFHLLESLDIPFESGIETGVGRVEYVFSEEVEKES